MAQIVRRRPPAPADPRYRDAADLVVDRMSGFLVAPPYFPPRALGLEVEPAHLLEIARFLRDEPRLGFDLLSCVSGVDMLDHLQVVYHLHSLRNLLTAEVKVRLDRESPAVASVVSLWPGADWQEREVYDLVGVRFIGHPDLRRIMLSDDFEGHPLRKDYLPPAYRGRISR